MTARQKEILEFIEDFWEENWTSPNVRQIAAAMGMKSPSTVHHHLYKMVKARILERKEVDRYRVLYRRRKTSSTPTSTRISRHRCS